MAGEGNPTGYAITIATGGVGTAGSNSFGISNIGNTSGTSGAASGAPIRYVFAGGNNITLSQSLDAASKSGTLTISAFNESQSIGMSNIGNTKGTTGIASGANVQYLLAGGNNVTLSQSLNGASGTVSVAAGGTLNQFWPYYGTIDKSQFGNGTIQVFPLIIPEFLTATQVNFFISNSISTSSNSSHAGALSIQFIIYTNNVSTLNSASSGSSAFQWSNTSDNSTASMNLVRLCGIPINVSATPGNYWGGFWSRTTTTNANWITLSNIVWDQSSAFAGPFLGASNATFQVIPGFGQYSVTSASIVTSIGFNEILGTGGVQRNVPYMNFVTATA